MIAEAKLWGTTVGYLASDEENNVYFTYDPAFITRGIDKYIKKAGLPHIKVHGFRHSCVS